MSQKAKSVDMRSNPLYPDRIENNAVGVLVALASIVVAIICLVLIVTHFSYAVRPERAPGYVNTNYPVANVTDEEQDPGLTEDFTTDDTEPYQEEMDASEPLDESGDMTQQELTEEEMPQELTGDYILAESSSRYLEVADLEGLSAEQLRLARNEIYARHGRLFDDAQLQEYFNSREWYSGSISPADFSEDLLNDYERQNTYLIQDYEHEMGYR